MASATGIDGISQVLVDPDGGVSPSQVLDGLPAAVYTTDASGRIDHFNPAAVELWGQKPVRGRDRWCGAVRLFRSDGRPMPLGESAMARTLKSGEPVRGEETILERPDGRRVTVLAHSTPLRDASGSIVGAVNMLVDITARKGVEDALRRRNAELADFVENMTVGVHSVGPDGTILWANQAELDMLGFGPDEYVGRHIAEFHVDGPVIDDILGRLARLETLKGYEARLRCKDGSIKYVLIDSNVYEEGGEFVHTRCFTRDVTAQKMIERRLAGSAAISHALSEATTLSDVAPRILEILSDYFNADIVELWLGEARLRRAALHARLPGKTLRAYKAASADLSFASGEGLPGRVRLAREPILLGQLSDSPRFAHHQLAAKFRLGTCVGVPVLFGDKCHGVITCFMRRALTSDLPLRNSLASIGLKLGQFIERSHEEEINRDLAALVEASPDAIVGASADDVITSWNEGAKQLFGYSAEEVIGKPLTLLVPKEKAFERRRVMARLEKGEPVKPLETLRLTKAGELVPVSINWCGIRDRSGKLIATPAIIRDISWRKATEAQLKARIRQLVAVSELGMLALANNDLQDLLHQSVMQVAYGLDVELAEVLELEPDEEALLLRSGVGLRPSLVGCAKVGAKPGSLAGYTLSLGRPVIVEDFEADKRFTDPGLLLDHGVVSGLTTVIRGEGEKPFGVLGACAKSSRRFSSHDVHFLQSIANVLTVALQRKAFHDRQAILAGELSHRVKNILAVILAMASQTGRQAASVDEFLRGFEGRLRTLSQVHDLLLEGEWSGANLKNLVQIVLGDPGEKWRLKLDLEDLELSRPGTQAMAMVFHELITNAMKYGAFSNDMGTIRLSGRHERRGEDQIYRISWREEGGPPVREPAGYGFGSRLIAKTVESQCGGTLEMDWRREGLTARITLPHPSIAGA